jgi:hypothetical protein
MKVLRGNGVMHRIIHPEVCHRTVSIRFRDNADPQWHELGHSQYDRA